MYLADTMSRAALRMPATSVSHEEMFHCYPKNDHRLFKTEIETIELDSPAMHPDTLEEIIVTTQSDPTLSALTQFVANCWPSDKSPAPTALRHYYPFRDELAV